MIAESETKEPYAFGDQLVIPSKGVLRMSCRICRKDYDHWSFECPFLQIKTSVNRPLTEPSICRICKKPAFAMNTGIDEGFLVRLMNLPMGTSESDLVNLVRRFGPLTHVSLSVNEKADSTTKSAVVGYVQMKDAEKAIRMLNGFDYYNAVLQVE